MVGEFGMKRCELLAERASGFQAQDSKFPQKMVATAEPVNEKLLSPGCRWKCGRGGRTRPG
jgi:hypothetical protein